jgi:hypothetical protein
MNEVIDTPGVPELNDEWIAVRTQHLIDEVTAPSPRRRRRIVLTSAGGGAVAVTALLVGILGPWASPAFAGWSAQPTTPSSDQLSTAEAECAALAGNLAGQPGATISATLPPVSLSDARGPYTLILFGTSNPAMCVVGANVASLSQNGESIGMSSAAGSADGNTVVHQSSTQNVSTPPSSATPPAPGAVTVDTDNTTVDNGQYFSVIEGQVGSRVSGATLLLSDGTTVVTTVSNGLFAAWWPGEATLSSIQVTTTAGVN